MEIKILSADGSKWQGTAVQENFPPKYIGWRCLHNKEGGLENDRPEPEVRPSYNARPVQFIRPMQQIAMALNIGNPYYTGQRYRSTYHGGIALCNGEGYEDPRAGPRCDWINMRDLNSPPPKLMKAIIFGGMFLRAEEEGSNLVTYPGVHGIDANKPLPLLEEILEKNWYMYAVVWNGQSINHFPQGGGEGRPCIVPYIIRDPTPYPKIWFEKWISNELPDPLKIYR